MIDHISWCVFLVSARLCKLITHPFPAACCRTIAVCVSAITALQVTNRLLVDRSVYRAYASSRFNPSLIINVTLT